MNKDNSTPGVSYHFIQPETLPVPETPDVKPATETEPAPVEIPFYKTNEFKERVRQYVNENNPLLAILTPCYGGLCNVTYVNCLIKTIEFFKDYGFPIEVIFARNDSLVPRARNNLIAKALSNSKVTHVIFIDADISWSEVDVLKLVLANKPIIGGVYPLKGYNWNRLLKDPNNPYNSNIIHSLLNKFNSSILKGTASDEEVIQTSLLKYNLNYMTNVLNIDNNVAKVKHIATGFMMIQRGLLEKMMATYPETKYTDDTDFLSGDENRWAYALFSCEVAYDHYLSEDWLFCDRWVKMGGDVYIDVSINLTHTGIVDFKGNFLGSIL